MIFVGNEKICINICNSIYGLDNWKRIKYEFKLNIQKPVDDHKTETKLDEKEFNHNLNEALKILDGD